MYMCCHLSGLPPLNSGIGSETHSFPHFSSMSSIAPIFRNTWLFHYFLPFLVQTGFWVGAPRKETFAPITKVKCIVCIVHSKTQHYFDPSRESGLELELRFFQANSGGCYEQAWCTRHTQHICSSWGLLYHCDHHIAHNSSLTSW